MVRRRKTRKEKPAKQGPTTSRKHASLSRWNRAEDIPLDDEEQFHNNRDRILLEGEESWDDGLGEGTEVFGLKGLAEETESFDEDALGVTDEDDDEVWADEDDQSSKTKASASSSKSLATSTTMKSSDEESESDSDDTDAELSKWGKRHSAYYVDGQDEETSDYEAQEDTRAMEEQEAKRLQLRAREFIDEDDYGLAQGYELDVEEDDLLREDVARPAEAVKQSKASLLKELEKSSPETLALAREWEYVAEDVVKVEKAISSRSPDHPAYGLMQLHYQSLLTYAATLAFFLHLRASPAYATRPESLASHPVMGRLLSLKTAVSSLECLGFSALDDPNELSDDDSEDDDELSDLDEEDMEALIGRVEVNGKGVRGMALSKAEMKELLMQAAMEEEDTGDSGSEEDDTPLPKTKRLSKAKEKATETKTVKAGKHAKSQQTNGIPVTPKADPPALPTPTFDLVEPTFESSTKKKSKQKVSSLPNGSSPAPGRIDDSDYVEPTSLAEGDQGDKTKRKRELQFHTSRIKKRAGKERASFGGDDDIPYRSDRRKNQMLQPDQDKGSIEANSIPLEGNRRVWGQSSSAAEPDDGGDGEWGGIESEVASGEGVKRTRASVEADEAEDGDPPTTEYLELVRSAKRQKKEEKRDAYLVKEAEKRKSYEDDAVLGPRTLTKDMLHNRGLTPRRKKKSANPWTKKRIQYEKAQKKLSSTRAVYKGGENALGGQYEGEMTGITRDVIKSVKFG